MKTKTKNIGGILTALIGIITLVVVLQSAATAADTTAVQTAIQQAEANAAKAIAKGDLAAAKGWAEVSFQMRAGQYLAPIGELAAQFTGQLGNLKAFVAAGVEVENLKPLKEWYDGSNRYSTEAVQAVMLYNDPAKLRLVLARQAAWTVCREVHYKTTEALDYKVREASQPKPADLLALMNWIETGATAPTVPGSELMTKVITTPTCQDGLGPYLKTLRETSKVAVK